MIASAATAEAKTTATLGGDLAITTQATGVDAAKLVDAAKAKAVIEGALDAIAACGAVEGEGKSHTFTLEVDKTGAVTKADKVASDLDDAFATCASAALQALKFDAFEADATVVVSGALSVSGAAAVPPGDVAGVAADADKAMDDLAKEEAKQPVATEVDPEGAKQAAEAEAAKQAAEAAAAEAAAKKAAEDAVAKKAADEAAAAKAAAEAAAAKAAAEAAATPVTKSKKSKKGSSSKLTSEVAGADEKDSKPWSVNATFEQWLGAGTFVKDAGAKTPAYGYAVTLGGSYKINDLLRASARIDFDQQLTTTHSDSGTVPRQFFFRDIRLGVSAASLYKEEQFTDISAGASASLRLPTALASQADDRIFGLVLAGNLTRVFDDLGPGNLTLKYSLSGRYNAGPRAPDVDADESATVVGTCSRSALKEDGSCQLEGANIAGAISNTLSAEYVFLEDYSIGASIGISNSFYHRLNDSSLEGTGFEAADISSSEHSSGGVLQSDVISTSIEAGYVLNDYVSFALGLATASNPFIYRRGNPNTLRFPFWDFNSTASNISQMYFDVNLSY